MMMVIYDYYRDKNTYCRASFKYVTDIQMSLAIIQLKLEWCVEHMNRFIASTWFKAFESKGREGGGESRWHDTFIQSPIL